MSAINAIGRDLGIARRHFEFLVSRLPSRERRCYRQFAIRRADYFRSYWYDVAARVDARIEDIGYGFFRLRKNSRSTCVRQGEVMLDDHLTLEMAGNKALASRLLFDQGYAVPPFQEYGLDTINRAYTFMRRLGGNFVVKPAVGSGGGRGICTRVNCRKRLINASFKAAIHSSANRLLIETQQQGHNYRLLYLNGEFIDAIRRDAPTVTGDGQSSLAKLINRENRKRLESGNTSALSPLTVDLDMKYTLSDQSLSLRKVPAAGDRIMVKTASNQNNRWENHSVRKTVHPSIIDYGRRASEVFGVTLSGVDMMIHDHEAPLEASGCLINEINTTPGLHHHDLIARPDDRVEVGAMIIDFILTAGKRVATRR